MICVVLLSLIDFSGDIISFNEKSNQNQEYKQYTSLLKTKQCLAEDLDDDEEFFSQEIDISSRTNGDPFEKFNRKMYNFNLGFYKIFLFPVSNFYNNYIPIEIRWTFKNFVQHYTETPKDAIYSVLDFDLEGMLVSTWRFAINTVFGFFGLFDVANELELLSCHKTLEEVMHFYGIPTGNYLVLPFLGSTTVSGLLASGIDFVFFNPWFWPFIAPNVGYIFSAHNYLNPFLLISYQKSSLIYASLGMTLGNYTHLITTEGSSLYTTINDAIDGYTSVRDRYLQMRKKQMEKYDERRKNGTVVNNNICDYDAYIDLPDECEEDPKDYEIMQPKDIKYR